jgi:hypothetical protein
MDNETEARRFRPPTPRGGGVMAARLGIGDFSVPGDRLEIRGLRSQAIRDQGSERGQLPSHRTYGENHAAQAPMTTERISNDHGDRG